MPTPVGPMPSDSDDPDDPDDPDLWDWDEDEDPLPNRSAWRIFVVGVVVFGLVLLLFVSVL